MKKRLLLTSMLLIGLVAGGLLTPPSGAATPAGTESGRQTELLEQLQGLVRQLRQRRQEYYEQKTRDEAAIQKAQENRTLLRTQLEEVRKQEADLDRQLEAYRAQVQALEAKLAPKAALENAVDREIAAFVPEQQSQIEAGIPYRQAARIARLHAGQADANEPTAASATGRLAHLWSYAQEELRLAAASETYTERAAVEDGVLPYARYFRIGQLTLGYVTEDGRQAAIWLSPSGGGRWQPLSEPGQVASLRDTVEILDRQQAPRFVSLPMDPGLAHSDAVEP